MPRILAGGYFPDDFVLSVIPAMELSLHLRINTVLPHRGAFLTLDSGIQLFQNPSPENPRLSVREKEFQVPAKKGAGVLVKSRPFAGMPVPEKATGFHGSSRRERREDPYAVSGDPKTFITSSLASFCHLKFSGYDSFNDTSI